MPFIQRNENEPCLFQKQLRYAWFKNKLNNNKICQIDEEIWHLWGKTNFHCEVMNNIWLQLSLEINKTGYLFFLRGSSVFRKQFFFHERNWRSLRVGATGYATRCADVEHSDAQSGLDSEKEDFGAAGEWVLLDCRLETFTFRSVFPFLGTYRLQLLCI